MLCVPVSLFKERRSAWVDLDSRRTPVRGEIRHAAREQEGCEAHYLLLRFVRPEGIADNGVGRKEYASVAVETPTNPMMKVCDIRAFPLHHAAEGEPAITKESAGHNSENDIRGREVPGPSWIPWTTAAFKIITAREASLP